MYSATLPDPANRDGKSPTANAVICARATVKYAYPRHTTPYLLVANDENPGDYLLNDRPVTVGGSCFYFLNPGDTLEIAFDGKKPTRPLLIQFTPSFVARVTAFVPALSVPFHADPVLRRRLDHIRTMSSVSQLALDNLLYELLIDFQSLNAATRRQIDSLDALKPGTRREIYSRLTLTRQYMEDNMSIPLSLDELAREAHMNVFHFLKCFKTLYHTTPHRYLRKLRLDRAHRLLSSGLYTVEDICSQLAFESSTSFSTLFKKTFGITPGELRRGR
jgi:AraC family transcriptional regulator